MKTIHLSIIYDTLAERPFIYAGFPTKEEAELATGIIIQLVSELYTRSESQYVNYYDNLEEFVAKMKAERLAEALAKLTPEDRKVLGL